MCSYKHTHNSAVHTIDPDGERIKIVEKRGFLGIGRKTIEYIPGKGFYGDNQYVKDTWDALNALSIIDEDMIFKIVSSKKIVNIKNQKDKIALYGIGPNYNLRKTVSWNSRVGAIHTKIDGSDNGNSAPYRILGHELRHWYNRKLNRKFYRQRYKESFSDEEKERWTDPEEKYTIAEENKISQTTGEPQRDSHNDTEFYLTKGPLDTNPASVATKVTAIARLIKSIFTPKYKSAARFP